MENPEIKFDREHTIPADIEESNIKAHIEAALAVAKHGSKTVKLIRESNERPAITLYIKPDSSIDKIMEDYSGRVKKLTPDGIGKDGKKISSPEKGINQQDI